MNKLKPRPRPIATKLEWGSRHQLGILVLLIATGIGMYLCFRLALPFLAALAWALALSVLFNPVHRRLEAKIKGPNLAATITVVMVALVMLLITAFVGERLVSEVVRSATVLKAKVESGDWNRAVETYPYIAPIVRWIETNTDLSQALKAASSWLATRGASLVQASMVQLIGVLLTFYFLFFFLRDRHKALRSLRSLVPLPAATMDLLCARVGDTINATLYGTLAVAAVQGTLGGLMFWALGLPAPVLWGVVMGLLAIVPVLGAFIVWIPAALFLLADGSWGKAIVLAAWGGIVVGGIDNLLYPMLVGNRLHMPTLVAFISIVGGLILFGASGVILGPVSVTITTVLLEYWRTRILEPASANSPSPDS